MINEDTGQRELAYIAEITNVAPIEGANAIELVTINDGWVCIAKIGEFSVGDLCVYFEVDSKLDEDNPVFAFMAPKHYKVKIMKLGKFKVFSQGLALPLSAFGWSKEDYQVGDFVTEKLKVTYSVQEDNTRKSNVDKYKQMAQRQGKRFSKKPYRWLMKREWGRKLLFLFFGRKKDKATAFPTKFPYVSRSDEERCLFAKTKITTDQGDIEISKIVNQKLNVKVLSMNPDGTLSFKKILDYQKFDNKEDVLTITYPFIPGVNKTNSIVCTKDHRFYTQRGYVHAKDLTTEDKLYMPAKSFGEDCIGAIYGMLLGDGHIYNDKRAKGKLRVVQTNGEAQLDYLKYKSKCFQNEGKICKAGHGAYENSKMVYHWFMPVDSYIDNRLKKDFYINGKKTVTKQVCDSINEEGLAFWYMDDGNLSYRDEKNQKANIRLNTQGFSKEENELLVEMLNNKFNISCHITKESRKGKPDYYHIYIDINGTPKFLKLVTPYMCKSMIYKTLPRYEYLIETKIPNYYKTNRVLPIPILNIEVGQKKVKGMVLKPQYVYDLEIEDNHNFISANIVSHNCENMPFILKDKTPYIKTTKIDGTSTLFILERKPLNRREFYVCSRNVRQLTPKQETFHSTNVYWEVENTFHIRDFLEDQLRLHKDWSYVAIQGETAGVASDGGKIQGDPHKFGSLRFFGYNFIDSVKGRWNSVDARELASEYGIEWVPIVDTEYILPDDLEEFKLSADGNCEAPYASGLREGYVYRSTKDPNISFKNISREYLMKH